MKLKLFDVWTYFIEKAEAEKEEKKISEKLQSPWNGHETINYLKQWVINK